MRASLVVNLQSTWRSSAFGGARPRGEFLVEDSQVGDASAEALLG